MQKFTEQLQYAAFQFTHPRGVRSLALSPPNSFTCFNSRTREGCDGPWLEAIEKFVFQFTHPRGVRFHRGLGFLRLLVSIHAPARGAMRAVVLRRTRKSFNSRTREGCDNTTRHWLWVARFQFTHPRGVRFNQKETDTMTRVSIHAPARGAIQRRLLYPLPEGFNSRTREGCDTARRSTHCDNHVSIHAPARGAIFPRVYDNLVQGFNSRTREGCDKEGPCYREFYEFQFTHPRGVRCPSIPRDEGRPRFNSRTREGCDS